MSTSPQPLFGRTQDQAVLGELLHSLSQPLTTLRCSLELSVDELAGRQPNILSAAIEQTDRVIAVVRLIREYLETGSAPLPKPPIDAEPCNRRNPDRNSIQHSDH